MILSPNNCSINERTGDGRSVGRCWFHCPDDTCPRHGNVHEELEHYRATGKLTDELEFDEKKKKARSSRA